MMNSNLMTRWRSLCVAALVTGACTAWPTLVNAAASEAEAGEQVFEKNCAACHTVGKGNLVGPDLQGVIAKRPREWLQHWIAAPDQMLADNDPIAIDLLHQFHDVPMPNLRLSAADVSAVLAYLETRMLAAAEQPSAAALSGPGAAAESTPSAPAMQGDPDIGKDLFIGAARFRNGGPPCMGCHSVAGIGALGGGQLGPDLTTVVTRFGGVAALSAFVGGSPTPTMNAIWLRTPLTADERADVVAFLAHPMTRRAPQAIWQLALLAVLGLAILLAIAGGVWRGRLREVRRPMIAGQRQARS